jgi:O-antigen ligase
VTISVNKPNTLFGLLAAVFIAVSGLAVFTEQYFLIAIPFAILLFYAGWQNRNNVFLLLLFTLPLSFEYNFSTGIGTDIPDELLMLVVSGLFFAYWLYSPKAISKNILQHPLMLLLLVVLCWTVVTVLFSTHQQISLKYLLAKSWYIGAFVVAPVIVFRTKRDITIAAITLVSSMLLIAIMALIRHYNTEFSFGTINNAVSPFFRNHVNYSAMLVCILPVLVSFFQLSKRKNLRLLIIATIAITLTALFFSYARGAWLALLAGVAAYWLIKKRLLLYSYIAAIIITISLLFWIKSNDRYLQYAHDYKTTIFHANFTEHLIATYKLKDVSTEERFYRWIAGVRMIKDNWLTGFGPNTFYDNYKGYTVPAYKTWVSNNPEHSTVHNYFLLTAIEQGVPGLLFLLFLFGAMLYYAQKLYHRIEDIFYRTVAVTAGVMLTMIVVVNFLSDLIETDKIGSLFFLCLSMLIVADVNSRKELNLSPHVKGIP